MRSRYPKLALLRHFRILPWIAGLLLWVPLSVAQPDTRVEVQPPPEPPSIVTQEDGTMIFSGTALPSYIVVGSFLTEVHLVSQRPGHWEILLDRIGLTPEDEAAKVLKDAADQGFELQDKIDTSEAADYGQSVAAVNRLASLWQRVRHSVKAASGSTQALDEYLDETVRRSTTFTVSPSSLNQLPTIEAWGKLFTEAVEQ